MPIARFQLEDGRIARFEVPDGTTPDMAQTLMQEYVTQQNAPEQPAAPKQDPMRGDDQGAVASAVSGFNDMVPFGNRITAGAAALANYPMAKITNPQLTLADLYDTGRANQKATEEAHPTANTVGSVAGLVNSLPLALATGGGSTTPVLGGAANAVSKASAATTNFVRGGNLAADAGLLAKAGNLGLQSVKSAAVAAPLAAFYSYGNSNKEGVFNPERIAEAGQNAELAAGIGAALPVAGAALGTAVNAVVPKVSAAIQPLAKRAQDFGIDLRLDQVAPGRVRNTVQKISQDLPFSGVGGAEDRQIQQWHSALAKTIGQDTNNLGPETINNYLKGANTDFESALANKVIKFGQKDINDIADVAKNATRKVSSDLATVVQNNVNDFLANLSPFKVGAVRNVPGERLASFRSQLLSELPSIEGGARQQVANIIDKIDGVVDRHLTPAEAKTLQTARYQWRNFRTIEPLLEKSTDGTINPTQLLNRVAASKYIKASRSTVGQDDLVDLARIGKQFMPKLGGSDTATKSAFMHAGKIGGWSAAGTAGVLDPVTTAMTLGANRAFQSGINQNPMLVNRAINRAASDLPLLTNGGAFATPFLSQFYNRR